MASFSQDAANREDSHPGLTLLFLIYLENEEGIGLWVEGEVGFSRYSSFFSLFICLTITLISCGPKTTPPGPPPMPSAPINIQDDPPAGSLEFSWMTIDGNRKTIENLRMLLEERMRHERFSGLSLMIKQSKYPQATDSYLLNIGAEKAGGDMPIDALTVFRSDRLGQSIIGYIALQLATYGQFDIDRPIHHNIPDSALKGTPYEELPKDKRWNRLTARLILSHQSGLADSPAAFPGGKTRFFAKPGGGFGYSEDGFALLKIALELRFKLDLNEVAKRLVFEPFHMQRTSFRKELRFERHLAGAMREPENTAASHTGGRPAFYTNASDYLNFMWIVRTGNPYLARRFYEPLFIAPSIAIKSASISDSLQKAERRTLPLKLSWCLGWGSYFIRWYDLVCSNFSGQKEPGLEVFTLFSSETKRQTAFIAFIVNENPQSFMPIVVEEILGKIDTPLAWLGFE